MQHDVSTNKKQGRETPEYILKLSQPSLVSKCGKPPGYPGALGCPLAPPLPGLMLLPPSLSGESLFVLDFTFVYISTPTFYCRVIHQKLSYANGHTTLNAPLLVRSAKLSNVGSGQYLDG